jgi:competence protein ComGC
MSEARPENPMQSAAGFALVELLVVALLLPVVLVAVLSVLDTGGSLAPTQVEYSHAVQEGSVGLQGMVREVRQAYNVLGSTPNSIDFLATIDGVDEHIFYGCDQPYPANPSNPYAAGYHRCLRVSAPTGSPLPPITTGTVAIDRLLNGTLANPVFTFTPDPISPTYVEAQIQIPARGALAAGPSHAITLDAGTQLRNYSLGT